MDERVPKELLEAANLRIKQLEQERDAVFACLKGIADDNVARGKALEAALAGEGGNGN